jgi:DivIVA domain-containing protein
MAPEQEALYALHWNVPRSELSVAARLEYDRLRPAWERRGARPAAGELEAARLAWEREHAPADERRGSLLATKAGRYARPVTGDKIRDTTFLTVVRGYDVAQVDDLLRRVAGELDAGRPAEPLIKNAIFRTADIGYDRGAVDWFLGQLLIQPGLAELSSDPWHDLGVVAQFTRSGVPDVAGRSARRSRRAPDEYYAEECRDAWHDFDKQPGMYLRMGWVGINCRELLTMEAQPIASMQGCMLETLGWPASTRITINIGEKSFTLKKTRFEKSPSPDIAEMITRSSRDFDGHFAANMRDDLGWRVLNVRELVDETGIPVLYTSGSHWNRSAHAGISFPGQRWLRFPVRGTRRREAIMTAVDEAGNSVVRYRIIPPGFFLRRSIVEITVHPGWPLTDELVLAIAISAPWLNSYFSEPGSGGG